MTLIQRGLDKEGKPLIFNLDDFTIANLNHIKKRVEKLKWDSKVILSGYSGVGKSHTVQFFAKYLCEWFDETYYCFTADEFIEKCNSCPEFSAIVLDEAFASMNSKISMSKDFQKIINFLQIVRQKHLYIFLLLPNFFDLGKSVALYMTSLLFVCYEENDQRGRFAVFDREKKKELYIKGVKYMNYQCVEPNYRGKIAQTPIIDWDEYEKRKREHFLSQIHKEDTERKTAASVQRDKLLAYCKEIIGISMERIEEIAEINKRTAYDGIERQKEYILNKFST